MSEYIAGLDLGQTSDPTAYAVAEKIHNIYHVRHIERFKLGTHYTSIIDRMKTLYTTPVLSGSTLGVDQTGVGRPIVEMLFAQDTDARIIPITITAGTAATKRDDGWHVPKKDLVASLQVVFQSGRLKIAGSLPLASVLTKELSTFRVKITKAANETFEAWRDGDHDDLVLALAMVVWIGERLFVGDWDPAPTPGTEKRFIGNVPNDPSFADPSSGFYRKW